MLNNKKVVVVSPAHIAAALARAADIVVMPHPDYPTGAHSQSISLG
jgi:hypothetical protein